MGKALQYALQAMDLLPAVLKGISGAMDAYNAAKAVIGDMVQNNRDPTPDEWASLNEATDRLRTSLHTDDSPAA